ncbi:MAG: hypothetical protein GY749_49305 [Desulfobacteraceae bacterium]|nr:hypothetical protein [Desulfobacteraceae bacterium]
MGIFKIILNTVKLFVNKTNGKTELYSLISGISLLLASSLVNIHNIDILPIEVRAGGSHFKTSQAEHGQLNFQSSQFSEKGGIDTVFSSPEQKDMFVITYSYGFTSTSGISSADNSALNNLEISFPRSIKAGESRVVEARLTCYGAMNPYVPALKKPVTLKLVCANFSIKPKEAITKMKGDVPPFVWSWSIASGSPGNQKILFDLSELELNKYEKSKGGYSYFINVAENGVKREAKDVLKKHWTVTLPIKVLTILGNTSNSG